MEFCILLYYCVTVYFVCILCLHVYVGGRLSVIYTGKKVHRTVCGDCGNVLHGVCGTPIQQQT